MTENTGTVETVEAEIVNDEETAVAVVEGLMPTKGLDPRTPNWMEPAEADNIQKSVDAFMEKIKNNPTDLDIQVQLYKLGDDGSKAMMPQCNLFNAKMTKAMEVAKNGDPVIGGILDIKQALDMINPAIIKKQPLPVKAYIFFKKHELPGEEKVREIVYDNRETVQSTVDGIKRNLMESADMIIEDIEEVKTIYASMLEAQRLVERDIFWAQCLHEKLIPHIDKTTDALALQGLEDNAAALTQVVLSLQSEEAANMIFFANAQNYAKQALIQLHTIRKKIPLMERAVMANLGLNVAMNNLQNTMRATDALSNAIGDTLADAAQNGRQMGVAMTEARGKATINIDKLQAAVDDIAGMYVEQAEANKKVIAIGTETSKNLSGMVGRVRERVEGGHESMSS